MIDPGVAALALSTILAGFCQGATGFGFGVLVAPVFVLLMPPADAVQLVALLSIAMSLLLVPALRGTLDRRILALLFAGSCIGFRSGSWLHARSRDVPWLKLAIGLVASSFAILLPGRSGSACDERCLCGKD
ncbi:MAG: sulfite exporter TauE/SafE family protein [Geminicoccaceae bacterium]